MHASRLLGSVLLASAATVFAGCGDSSAPDAPTEHGAATSTEDENAGPTWFVERARERGLTFTHERGEPRYWFPEIMGSGLALFDCDGDADLDVYLVQSGDLAAHSPAGRNRLFLNAGDGTFNDATDGSGADDDRYGMGVCVGDFDADGRPDLYVTNVGRNTLLRNLGGGRFEDVTEAAGVGDESWGTSAAFLDADADGDLDLFVVNYLSWDAAQEIDCQTSLGPDYCSPNSYEAPARDTLYENLGDGTFRDVSVAAGLGKAFGNGLGLVTGDFDDDGRTDVYVANDMMPNQLWMARGPLAFEDDALLAGCAANGAGEAEAGMGAVAFDFEDDGDLDLFVTHLRGETNTLYVNDGGFFRDRTTRMGLAGPSVQHTGFGVCLADFDHDGVRDLYVANGSVTRARPPHDPDDPYAEPDLLFRGLAAAAGFEVVPGGGAQPHAIETSRGAACGDLDGDGDLDVVVLDSDGPVRLLENVIADDGEDRWLRVRFASSSVPAPSVIGARVRVEIAGRTFEGRVAPASSYCSSGPLEVHFGLGSATGPATVTVELARGDAPALRLVAEDVVLDRVLTLDPVTLAPSRDG